MVSSMSTNAKASVPASSRGTAVASPVRTREWTASSCRTCPKEKERRNVPQRRRRPHPREHLPHAAVAQHVEVIDAVRAGEHPADHAGRLDRRVR